MNKYWCKIDDGVEGPYEPQVLRFIDGFSPDILVSPDNSETEETWLRYSEVEELQALLNSNPKTGPGPVVIKAPSPAEASTRITETLEEIWEESFEVTVRGLPDLELLEKTLQLPPPEITLIEKPDAYEETIELPPKEKISPETIQTPKPIEEVISEITSKAGETINQTPSTIEPITEAPVESKEEFVASSDLLDVMQEISREIDQRKSQAIPETEAPPVLPIILEEPQVEAEPAPKSQRNYRTPVLVAVVIMALASTAYWGVKSGKPKAWMERIIAKFQKKEKLPEPEMIEPVQLPELKPMIQPLKPKVIKRKTKTASVIKTPPKPVVKIEEEKVELPVVVEKPEVEQKELENQNFYMPGVPSPKLSTSKANISEPLPEDNDEEPLKPAAKNKKKNPQPKEDESSNKTDWKGQSSWGD